MHVIYVKKIPVYSLVKTSVTVGLKFQLLPQTEGYQIYGTLKFVHDTPRPATYEELKISTMHRSRSQWPCGLRLTSAADRLLRLWVRIPPEAYMSVCCECCVL
jgi:hypothetical protein